MGILILDPNEADALRERYAAEHPDRPTEVWEGVTVVPPMANTEHFRLSSRLCYAFSSVIDWDGGDEAVPGGNVSDRDDQWEHNYRNPDVIVALAGGVAIDRGSYWVGGPDLVVEIISRGEDSRAKFGFYAAVGTREVLIVDRHPWAVELFRLTDGAMASVGRSEPANPVEVASAVLPLAFRLRPATPRPTIVMRHTTDGRTWTA